jgi:hypothetical protein
MAKYIVGPKASFVFNGRIYGPGEVIDDSAFGAVALNANIKSGHLTVKPDEQPPSGNNGTSRNSKTIDEMGKAELIAYAASKGLNISGTVKEIRDAIKEAESQSATNKNAAGSSSTGENSGDKTGGSTGTEDNGGDDNGPELGLGGQ